MTVVLDADVLIGALDGDDAYHTRARESFRGWRADGTPRCVSTINLAEALVGSARDPQHLRTCRSSLTDLGVTVELPTEAIAVDAAGLRARHSISLADAFLLATARARGATVASFDGKVTAAAAAEGIEASTP